MNSLFDRHRHRLDQLLHEIRGRWPRAPYDAAPDVVTETSGRVPTFARYVAKLGPVEPGGIAATPSPFGVDLAFAYPETRAAALLDRATAVASSWQRASVEQRTGVALEIVQRLRASSPLLADGLMHSTGEPRAVALAGSIAAAIQSTEIAVAEAYERLRRLPGTSRPSGSALIEAPALRPLAASLASMVACLVGGRPVLLAAPPEALLPCALVAAITRDVLVRAGAAPDIIQLCAADDHASIGADTRLRYVDAASEPANLGCNPVIIDGTDDVDGLCGFLATELLFVAGQRPNKPQAIMVPDDGIGSADGRIDPTAFGQRLVTALQQRVLDTAFCAGKMGAIQDPGTLAAALRLAEAPGVLCAPDHPSIPGFPAARTLGPVLVAADGARDDLYGPGIMAPVAILVSTTDTAESIERAAHVARLSGARNATIFSTSDLVLEAAADALSNVTPTLAFNPLSDRDAAAAETAPVIDEAFVAERLHPAERSKP